jgi:hypothetical protein
MRAQGSRKFRRALEMRWHRVHSEAFSAKFFLRIDQAAMLFSWARAWENVPWNPQGVERIGAGLHSLLTNVRGDGKCRFCGRFPNDFSGLSVCAFYVTQRVKKPVIRPKKPLCGLEALAQPPPFVFSSVGQLTHRPKSQARGL